MLSKAGLVLIDLYQRQLSPRKGFRCAYGSLYGAGTCSSIGKQIMREGGVFAFLRLMPEQFAACKAATMQLRNESEEERKRRRQQRRDRVNDYCENMTLSDCWDAEQCTECACDVADIGSCDFSSD